MRLRVRFAVKRTRTLQSLPSRTCLFRNARLRRLMTSATEPSSQTSRGAMPAGGRSVAVIRWRSRLREIGRS